MSKDFYFHKWNETLNHLKKLVDIDIQYQVTKVNDATLPAAVLRLSSILGQYMLMYNAVIECFQQNLQVQKTAYMDRIVKVLVSRILELKSELEKLENNRIQFIGYGLIEIHHTTCEIDMTAIPAELGRPEHIQAELDTILANVKENKEEAMAELSVESEEEKESTVEKWDQLWGTEEKIEEVSQINKATVVEIPEAIRKTREYLALILAHEKTRQVIQSVKQSKLRRDKWVKELTGRLVPPARYEVRARSAELIQKVFRAYFEFKRERIKSCKRDELMGLNICDTKNFDLQKIQCQDMLTNRSKLHKEYEKEWIAHRDDLKQKFLEKKSDELCDEFRDNIRQWFIEWFESVQFFYDIPKAGSAAIFRNEVPDPYDWLEQNKALAITKEANKNKSSQQLKLEKMEAKRQEMLLKREERLKQKTDAQLLRKMMANPKNHPGYTFPLSKQTDQLLGVIDYYHKSWDMYDVWETLDVKVKYVHDIDVEDAMKDVQLEVLPKADEEMRKELRQLKKALKEDYERNEEEMPVDLTQPIKRKKNKKIVKMAEVRLNEEVCKMIEELAELGIIIEYPKVKIEDFVGDPNFVGEDLRRENLLAFPFNFEIRAYWWERCRKASLGVHKILLVGAKNSGRTMLVHALASINDAVLFELDPHKIQDDMLSSQFLKHLVDMVVKCARALQPSVIHIKHVQKLFYSKIPPQEAELHLPLLKTFFIRKLINKIRKTDKITVVGTCSDPWLTKAGMLLRQFPELLLLPNCSYSLVVQILKNWIVKHHHVIPANFNISSLAHVLQGYSFGFLEEALDKFLSADRIVKIAAYGVTPMEVYDFILEDKETKVEYDKYLKWYFEKTTFGRKEMHHLQEQRAFKAAVEKYVEKNKKKIKSGPSSTVSG